MRQRHSLSYHNIFLFHNIILESDFDDFSVEKEFNITSQRSTICQALRIMDDSLLEETENFYVTITATSSHVQSAPNQLMSRVVIIDNESMSMGEKYTCMCIIIFTSV